MRWRKDVVFTSDNIPMPEMNTREEAAEFVSDELSEWFFFLSQQASAGRQVDPGLLCDLAQIAGAVGEFLRTGKRPKTQDWPKETLVPLAKIVTERSRGDEDLTDYAWLFAVNLERAVRKLDGCEVADVG